MFTESDGKTYTISDYEKIVKTALAEENLNLLQEHSNRLQMAGYIEAPNVDPLLPEWGYRSWIEFLNQNGSKWALDYLKNRYLLAGDYDMAAWSIECFIKGKEERGEAVSANYYYLVGAYKYAQVDENIPYEEMIQKYEGKILATRQWYQRAIDAGYNRDAIDDGSWCLSYKRKEGNGNGGKEGGCYIATCVYGSYDCPEVWTLRRFRDYTLAETWYGRLFIHTYYAISPTIVKWFGNTNWFKKLWRGKLDKLVKNLNEAGVANTKYEDKEWHG